MATNDNKLGIKVETVFDFTKSEQDLIRKLQQLSRRGLNINTSVGSTSLRGLNSELTRTNVGMSLLASNINSVYRKFTTWYIVADVVKSVFGSIRDGINDVIFLNSKLLEIDYSMNLTNEQMIALAENSNKVAHELNSVSDNVLRANAIFSNANESMESLNKKSESTIILSNLSGSSIEKMADAVNAASFAFDIHSDKLDHVSDVMVKVATETGIDFQKSLNGISDSLAIGGNVAASYGLTLEQWTAIVGKTAESTRASFGQTSRGLVTVLTRLNTVLDANGEDISNLEGKYKDMGIVITDANHQLLPTMDILKNISDIYPRLTKNQKNQVAQLAGATRNQRFFNAVMMNYNGILELTEKAENSQGEAMRLNEKRSDSLLGAQDRLTQARKEFFRALISEQNIDNFLKFSTGLLNNFTKIISETKLLDVVMFALGVKLSTKVIPAFGLFVDILGMAIAEQGVLGGLILALSTASLNFGAFVEVLKLAIAEEGILNGVTLALNTTFLTLEGTIAKIVGASGFGILFYAMGQVIKGLIDATARSKDFKNAMEGLAEAQKNLNKRISDASYIEDLEKIGTELETMKAKWDDLQDQAKHPIGKEQLGETKVGIDKLKTSMLEYGIDTENMEDDLVKKQQQVNAKKIELTNELFKKRTQYEDLNIKAYKNLYNIDLTSYKDYSSAKLAIDQQLLKNLGGMWSKYFDVVSGTYTESMERMTYGELISKSQDPEFKKGYEQVQKYKSAIKELDNIVSGTSKLGDSFVGDVSYDISPKSSSRGSATGSSKKEGQQLKESYDEQNKALEYQLTLIRDQRQELSNTSKEYQDNLHSENIIYQKQLSLNESFIKKGLDRQELQLSSLAIIKKMNDNSEDWWMTLNRGVDQTLKQIDYELQLNAEHLNGLTEGSQQWLDYQADSLLLIQNQRYITEEYIKQLMDQIDLNKLNGKELEDAQEKLKQLRLSYVKINNTIRDMETILSKQNEEILKAREDVEDKLVNIIKDRIQEEINQQDKLHDDVMKKLDEEHKQKVQNLEEEQKRFEDYINEQINLIDDRQKKESFDEELAKKQQERFETQKRISELALVGTDDRATNIERKQLEDQLKKQNEEINKFINNRSIDLKKDALKEELENYKDSAKDKKDMLDDEFKEDQDRENAKYEKHKERLTKQLENENVYTEARRMMEQSTTQELISLIWEYEKENGKAMSSAGDSIYNNLIKNLQTAKREVFDLKSAITQLEKMKSMKGVDYSQGGDTSSWNEKQMSANQKANDARSFLASEGYSQGASDISSYDYKGAKDWYNEYISDRTDLSSDVKNAFKQIVDAKKEWSNAAQFRVGGKTPSNIPNKGALAVLHKNERILNEDYTSRFDNLMSMVDSSKSSSLSSAGINRRNTELNIENLIKVEGNVDKSTIPQLKQVADKTLDRMVKILNGNQPNLNNMLSV